MKLIVGLGNKGNEYIGTRHNVGFMVLDNYLKLNNLTLKSKLDGMFCKTNIKGEDVIFLEPQNFINLSGDVIYKYMNYFKISKDDILVIHDDMDLDVGTFKIRYKGGSAGHNGLKNIELNLKTNEYKRIKIGISKNSTDKINYVLGKFNKEELNKLNEVMKLTPNIIEDFITLSFENLMNKYN